MPLVQPCATEGCDVLTMGKYCLDCETAELHRDLPDLLKALQVPTPEMDRTQFALPAA
jgi:hypothetical protein